MAILVCPNSTLNDRTGNRDDQKKAHMNIEPHFLGCSAISRRSVIKGEVESRSLISI